jgi:hypothetical protein
VPEVTAKAAKEAMTRHGRLLQGLTTERFIRRRPAPQRSVTATRAAYSAQSSLIHCGIQTLSHQSLIRPAR